MIFNDHRAIDFWKRCVAVAGSNTETLSSSRRCRYRAGVVFAPASATRSGLHAARIIILQDGRRAAWTRYVSL